MYRFAGGMVAAVAAGLLAVPGTASAAAPAPGSGQPRVQSMARPMAHRATGSLWLYYDAFFSGQVQEVLDPNTSACVNLTSPFDTWSQQSESTLSVEVYSDADCAGSPAHTYDPNEYQVFLPMTIASAKFLH